MTIIHESHEASYLKESLGGVDSLQVPYVEHSEGCGRQGRGIYVPESFLDSNPSYTNRTLSSRHIAETFVNKWIDFRFGVFGFDSSRGGERREEVFVSLSNETIDGVSSASDRVLRSGQARLCGGKTHEEVIAGHPDISQGGSQQQ